MFCIFDITVYDQKVSQTLVLIWSSFSRWHSFPVSLHFLRTNLQGESFPLAWRSTRYDVVHDGAKTFSLNDIALFGIFPRNGGVENIFCPLALRSIKIRTHVSSNWSFKTSYYPLPKNYPSTNQAPTKQALWKISTSVFNKTRLIGNRKAVIPFFPNHS